MFTYRIKITQVNGTKISNKLHMDLVVDFALDFTHRFHSAASQLIKFFAKKILSMAIIHFFHCEWSGICANIHSTLLRILLLKFHIKYAKSESSPSRHNPRNLRQTGC